MKEFALSIKGGAAYGFGAIGVLQFLEENNLKPKIMAGSSSGAIVAAMYALGMKPKEMIDAIKSVKVLSMVTLKSIFKKGTFIDYDKYKQVLLKFHPDDDIQNTKTKLIIFATDPIEDKRIFIEKGSIVEALIASSGYPPFLPVATVEGMHGRMLVDGDFTVGYSAKKLREEGADVVVGVCSRNIITNKLVQGNLIDRFLLIFQLYSLHTSNQNDSFDPPDMEIEYALGKYTDRFSFTHVEKLVEYGYREMKRNEELFFKLIEK